jgi:hypothetical protein
MMCVHTSEGPNGLGIGCPRSRRDFRSAFVAPDHMQVSANNSMYRIGQAIQAGSRNAGNPLGSSSMGCRRDPSPNISHSEAQNHVET